MDIGRKVLEEGDSFHWDGSIPHRIENHGAQRARLLVARTPPGFLDATVYEPRAEPEAPSGAPARRQPPARRRVR